MARDRDSAQDAEMSRMDKLNKNKSIDRKVKVLTLKEQLDNDAKLKAMTPDQRRSSMSWTDWEWELGNMMRNSKNVSIPDSVYQSMKVKYRSEFNKFHENGTRWDVIIKWMDEKSDEFLTW